MRRLRDERLVIIRRLELRGGFSRREFGPVNELRRLSEDAIGLVVLIECGTLRLLLQRRARPRSVVTRTPLPFTFQNAFVEVIHDERRLAEKTSGAG